MNRFGAYTSFVLLLVCFFAGCSQTDTSATGGTMMKDEDMKEGGMIKEDAAMKDDGMIKDAGK